MTETTASAGKSDPVTDLGVGDLESLVGGDTSTENGGGPGRVEGFGNRSNMVDEGDDVFGESTVGGIARELDVGTVYNGGSIDNCLLSLE